MDGTESAAGPGLWAVLLAAAVAWGLGAAWYGALARPWMAASGVAVGPDGRPANGSSPAPYLVSLLAMVLTAGMMRHVFVTGAVDTAPKGLLSGLGVGAFFVAPWLAMTNAYGMRPARLTLIDGGYALLACGAIGLVLGLS